MALRGEFYFELLPVFQMPGMYIIRRSTVHDGY